MSYTKSRWLHLYKMLAFSFLLFMCAATNGWSQQSIRGTVKDTKGEPIIGANVIEKGTTNGSITDLNGVFTFSVSNLNSAVTVSCIGYKSKVVPLDKKKVLDVILAEDVEALDEIVVVGYGVAKKRDLTGSVASVKGESLKEAASFSAIQAMQGKAAGVTITQTSSKPGVESSIRIRGNRSLKASNEPLYVVDGIPIVVGLNEFSPSDIESIEVLKDASATAIYGSRGANGVVMITTKKGEKGKTKISYNMEYGMQSQIKKWDLCDASEWMQLMNVQQLNDNGSAYFTDSEIAAAGKGYNWQDHVYRNAPVWNHNININGGSDNAICY